MKEEQIIEAFSTHGSDEKYAQNFGRKYWKEEIPEDVG
jgi:hypothetical protein